MKSYFYNLRYKFDQEEWRARAKRDLVFRFWEKFHKKGEDNFLDFGCGTGVLQEQLEKKFNAKGYGIDISKEAINYCKKRGLTRVKKFDGKKIPFKSNFFNLVTAIDVLEHIDNDLETLGEIKRVLVKGGLAILLVPAHPNLWSTRDINLHHKRRYKVGELENKCKELGFKLLSAKNVDFLLYFIFFSVCLLARKKNGIPNLKMEVAAGSANKLINEAAFMYERFENGLQNYIKFPVGLSIAVVAKKV